MQTSNMSSKNLSELERTRLDDLVVGNENVVLGKLQGDEHISSRAILKKAIDITLDKVSSGKCTPYVSKDRDHRLNGLLLVEESVWDSTHFERKLGKATLTLFEKSIESDERRVIIRQAIRSSPFEMISARISLHDLKTVQAMEQEGALLADVLLTYRIDFPNRSTKLGREDVIVSEAHMEDSLRLVEIGRTVFTIDRFHNDPHFSLEKSNDLYGRWVLNSFKGLADTVLVARVGNENAGFITCKIERLADDQSIGVIDLVGVAKIYQGQGVGAKLVQSANSWFSERVESAYVGTQAANSGATRAYENAGYRHVYSEATLHLWHPRAN